MNGYHEKRITDLEEEVSSLKVSLARIEERLKAVEVALNRMVGAVVSLIVAIAGVIFVGLVRLL